MEKKENLKTKILSGLFWKFAETACADVVSFVVSIVLARLLLPSDYGEIALVNVFIVIANVFVVNGLGTALIQKKDADDLDFSSVFYFNLGFSFVLYVIIWWIAPSVGTFFDMPHLSIVLKVLAMKVPLAAINSVQNAYISRKMIFKKSFNVTIIGTVISAIIGIYMAFIGMGVWALVAQVLSNSLIDTILLFVIIKWYPKLLFSFRRLRGLLAYGWKLLASSLIKVGYDELSNLIIGKFYTSADLAFYSKGKKYPNMVVTDINSTISSVLFPAVAKCQDDLQKVKSMTRRSIKISTYVMSPFLIGMAAVAEPLIACMLTDKWLPCVPYLRICCIYYIMQPLQTANLQAIRAIGRSDIVLKLDIIKRGSGLFLLMLLMRHGVMGVAVAPVGVSIIATIVNIQPNKKTIGYSYLEQFLDLIPNLLLATSMGVCVYVLSGILVANSFSNFLNLAITIPVGMMIYVIGSIIFKIESFQYVLSTIKELVRR